MRIDVVTIFPDYLKVLDLSLIGRAAGHGTLDLHVHDLRDHAHDRHRTVDDTPLGGGAGMVMKPDVWGEALDDVLAVDAPTAGRQVLIIPTPSGEVFTQRTAEDLADADALVFACGRYEGIDARVAEHYRAAGVEVAELSIGDYVLSGGEAAALVMIEAIARLRPGVLGNPDSVVEESHGASGLLEQEVYTRPVAWRGLDVSRARPELLSGDHARVARQRHNRAIARAIALQPQYLLCDEPNSGLDPKTSLVIDNLIQSITKEYNMTTIINTHDMNSVMNMGENIVFIKEGVKEWQGTKEQVVSSNNKALNDFIFASDLLRKASEMEEQQLREG